ncbi:hypothetical protein NX059_001779 [Plenodomus lindquistii]|nr:hypothetical protein NX059_001779 [Plenodomus lindquistii]
MPPALTRETRNSTFEGLKQTQQRRNIMEPSFISLDPFSDSAAIHTLGSGHAEDCDSSSSRKSSRHTACRPERVVVPILDTLSPLTAWSSFVSTPDRHPTAPTSPSAEITDQPIQWHNADLSTAHLTTYKFSR